MSEIALLLRMLDEAYEKSAWQGPNLRGALRGVRAREADWKPPGGRHSIRDLVIHAAYWKYAVRRQLTGEKRGSFPEKGSNWFERTGPATERAWRADLALLDAEHRQLRAAVAATKPAALRRKPRGSRRTADALIYGVASHDVYHTGQIQLIRRLRKGR